MVVSKKIVAVIAILFVVGLSASPQGKQLFTHLGQLVGASAVDSAGRYEVTVMLNYDNGGSFEWRSIMPRREYKEIDVFGKKIAKKYVGQAKKALAKKMGYFSDVYGSDSDKLQQCVVQRVYVTDLRSDRETNVEFTR